MTAIPIAPFGQPVILPGFWDTFPGADGSAPGNGWIDLADTLPFHAPALVESHRLGIGTATTKGQMGVYRHVGLTDGVEVTLRHQRVTAGLDGSLDDIGWQFGPSVFVDPTGAQTQMGMTLTWDISVTSQGAALVQMMGLFDASDYLTPAHYTIYEGAWMDTNNIRLAQGDVNVLKLRCFGGKCAGYWNGIRCLGPFDVPGWATGRDGWGAHNIMAGSPISNIGNLDVIRIQPWTASLGTYPAVPTVGTAGATVKAATAASVAVAYPTIVAGQLLVACVATNNGAFTTPTGWRSDGTATVASGICAQIFTKTADGTEAGTMTFTRTSGTGDCAGFMFAVAGSNPMLAGHGATGQANTSASTNLTSASRGCFGPNRLAIWVGATANNTAITAPASYTSIANCGTSGAPINLAAAYHSLSTAGQGTSGTITGTLATSVTSVGLTEVIDPDPR